MYPADVTSSVMIRIVLMAPPTSVAAFQRNLRMQGGIGRQAWISADPNRPYFNVLAVVMTLETASTPKASWTLVAQFAEKSSGLNGGRRASE